MLEFVPFTCASTLSSSTKVTVSVLLPSTTWLFVTINNSESFCPIIIPEPLLWLSYSRTPPKKSCTCCTLKFVIDTTDGITFSTISARSESTSELVFVDTFVEFTFCPDDATVVLFPTTLLITTLLA